MDDRSAVIQIGGTEYTMTLTTKATKEIAKRYGGLNSLGDKLLKAKNFEMALDEIVWLITLLINQGILIFNYKNKENMPLLNEETVELLTSPLELATYKEAIMEALMKGTARNIESEEGHSKNQSVE